MRNYLFYILIIINSTQVFGQSDPELENAIKNYQSIKKEINETLKSKTPDCLPSTQQDFTKTYCSIKDFCEKSEVKINNSIIYQNEKGEKIINDAYYESREAIRTCLKEKYKEEIQNKKNDLLNKLKKEYLKKILAENIKLNQLVAKLNEGSKIQKISAEIANLSLKLEISGQESNWNKANVRKNDLSIILKNTERKTKTKLNPEIKKSLIQIQFLKQNPSYLQEVDEMERAMIPEEK
ncbi:MAG: hypothetical protein Q7U04_08150, partial [Bacteriovorax sp.]|nr:hypothetical protein [Bacteriovorax sp.]